ncbi:ABC transporter permease [Fimbriiglobus ruber]|nr:ABC transporter permease [Fimbriiglobus ruber]
MPILAIAHKDLRLLIRDPRSAVILLVMPLVLILILGVSLGGVFGKKPDDRIRVSVVVEDAGLPPDAKREFPPVPWSDIFLDDLTDTANIRVERIATREEAKRLVERGDRAAVVVLKPEFSDRLQRCSFVGEEFKKDPINPLFRDGVRTEAVGVEFLTNPTQPVGSSVIQQVVQVSLFRVVIPWMIGQAFDLIGTEKFLEKMEKYLPRLPGGFSMPASMKVVIGAAMKKGIENFFNNYKFTAKTWSSLTKSEAPEHKDENRASYSEQDQIFGLKRGTVRYQVLVPSYTVTFAFFLVLTVGWLFVAERRHGTLTRLRLAPLSRGQILLGKVIPCLVVSLFQGAFLLLCGKLVFGMSWGPEPWLLVPVVCGTSLAAVGLAVLVAGLAKTETQVAVYGTLLVLVLAGVSGSMMPREMMPEEMRQISLVTPHAWALDAYAQLLNPDGAAPNVSQVLLSCGVLAGFGGVFLLLAWFAMKLE